MKIFEQLKPQTTFITPNRRLAATLIKKYHAWQKARHQSAWLSLDCLPFHNWALRAWQAHIVKNFATDDCLLKPEQEQILWEEIIKRSPAYETLLHLSASADNARAAWALIKQWQVALDPSLFNLTADGQHFLTWSAEYQQILRQNKWTDIDTLMQKLSETIENTTFPMPASHFFLVGFSELSPLQKKIFSACEKKGVVINTLDSISQTSGEFENVFRIELQTTEHEIETMARWAKSLLDRSTACNEIKNIACIVPQLETLRDRVEQIFLQVFNGRNDDTIKRPAFNISAGKKLSSYPIVHAALEWLKWPTSPITDTQLSYLLRSPFLGEAEMERFKRAHMDAHFRQANITHMALAELIAPQNKLNFICRCPALAKRMERFLNYFNGLPTHLPLNKWAHHFNELLLIIAWPGERSLNSHEYQITQRWLDLLKEHQHCQTLSPTVDYAEALYYLNNLARSLLYQPQSEEAPVQILGALEAAGLPFDAIWVLGLDDQSWPKKALPNPFIPYFLQKKLQMPHASPERELAYSKQLIEQFKKNSHTTILSYAKHQADIELRPSALITDLVQIDLAGLSLSDFIKPAELIFNHRSTCLFKDEAGPLLQSAEINGGSSVLKHQASCPFKAFATVRLKAKKLETPRQGLRPEDRGMMVHKALEQFWRTIKTSEHLLQQNDCELKKILSEAIQSAMQSVLPEVTLASRYLALERTRLHRLLWDWIEHEKKRPAFKVLALEHEYTANVGPLSLTLRIDRIDELADGTHFIIDYKTNKNNSIKQWSSERPDRPELPLYGTSVEASISGLAFAEIHVESMRFKGISKADLLIEGMKPFYETDYFAEQAFEAQMAEWKKIFIRLAEDFYQGHAAVDPKDGRLTCQQCDLLPLCRAYH